MLDGRHQIILANWPSYRKIMCVHNNNMPINIPSYPYVLTNRSILCNCDLEAESNFLLESLAVCENLKTKADLVVYFTVNLTFANYFEGAIENLNSSISRNWTTQEQILPVSIESLNLTPICSVPQNNERFCDPVQIQKGNDGKNEQKKIEEAKTSSKFGSFLDSFLVDMLLFIAALITVIITLVVMYVVCRQSKLKAFIAN